MPLESDNGTTSSGRAINGGSWTRKGEVARMCWRDYGEESETDWECGKEKYDSNK